MRKTLALLPAAWLALSGAALPEPTLQAVFECQAEVGPSLKLLETLPRTRDDDESEPPVKSIQRLYTPPADLTVFGFKPFTIASSYMVTAEGDQEVLILAAVKAPYKQVEAAMLKARGLKSCPMHGTGPKADCLISFL